jgi:bifunctional non-homologous end joining protein LigD
MKVGKPLKEYRSKRHFEKTTEPAGKRPKKASAENAKKLIFVIQEHHARRLHWDFRLEWGGVLKSWAVTKQPSSDASKHRLAIETEDHPLDYARFHGTIPKGEYGGGEVSIWDCGTYVCNHSTEEEMERGIIKVKLKGKRLKGVYILVRIDHDKSGPKTKWLFFKEKEKPIALRVPKI